MKQVCLKFLILKLFLIDIMWKGIKLAAEICSASLTGAEVASCDVSFRPGFIKPPRDYSADPGTAGSTTLLLQVSVPCLVFSGSPSLAPSTLTLRGGTNATMAPQIDYTQHIFLPFLRRHFGLDPTLHVQKRGYFPRGGGKIFCSVPPVPGPLPSVTLTDRGSITSIKGQAHVGGLPYHIALKMREGARNRLISAGYEPGIINIDSMREMDELTVGSGGGVVLWAETSGGCLIGGTAVSSKGTDPADIGKTASEELIRNLEHGGCVDEYLQVG
jgi:RNA 3'-terminal phosphate cyclase (ATP)